MFCPAGEAPGHRLGQLWRRQWGAGRSWRRGRGDWSDDRSGAARTPGTSGAMSISNPAGSGSVSQVSPALSTSVLCLVLNVTCIPCAALHEYDSSSDSAWLEVEVVEGVTDTMGLEVLHMSPCHPVCPGGLPPRRDARRVLCLHRRHPPGV